MRIEERGFGDGVAYLVHWHPDEAGCVKFFRCREAAEELLVVSHQVEELKARITAAAHDGVADGQSSQELLEVGARQLELMLSGPWGSRRDDPQLVVIAPGVGDDRLPGAYRSLLWRMAARLVAILEDLPEDPFSWGLPAGLERFARSRRFMARYDVVRAAVGMRLCGDEERFPPGSPAELCAVSALCQLGLEEIARDREMAQIELDALAEGVAPAIGVRAGAAADLDPRRWEDICRDLFGVDSMSPLPQVSGPLDFPEALDWMFDPYPGARPTHPYFEGSSR